MTDFLLGLDAKRVRFFEIYSHRTGRAKNDIFAAYSKGGVSIVLQWLRILEIETSINMQQANTINT